MTHSDQKTIKVWRINIVDGKSRHVLDMAIEPTIAHICRLLRNQDSDGLDMDQFHTIVACLDELVGVGTFYGSSGHVTIHPPRQVWLHL